MNDNFIYWAVGISVALALFMTFWREIGAFFSGTFLTNKKGLPSNVGRNKLIDEDGNEIKRGQSKDNWDGICPSCGGKRWMEGPRGGMCVNLTCMNAGCRQRLNVAEMPWGAMIVDDLGKCDMKEWKEWTGG